MIESLKKENWEDFKSEKIDDGTLVHIIVDRQGFVHLYVNGEKRHVTSINFTAGIEEVPELKTTELVFDRSSLKK